MRMINDRLLVEKDQPIVTTESGIFIKPAPQYVGTVLMAGPNAKYAKEGCRVKYFPHCGTEITFQGKECVILKEKDEIYLVL